MPELSTIEVNGQFAGYTTAGTGKAYVLLYSFEGMHLLEDADGRVVYLEAIEGPGNERYASIYRVDNPLVRLIDGRVCLAVLAPSNGGPANHA
jgi:hypothetical protein